MSKPPISQAAVRRAWANESLSVAEAGALIGLSRSAFWRRAQNLGLRNRGSGRKISMAEAEDALLRERMMRDRAQEAALLKSREMELPAEDGHALSAACPGVLAPGPFHHCRAAPAPRGEREPSRNPPPVATERPKGLRANLGSPSSL